MERQTVAERAYAWVRTHPFATDAAMAAVGIVGFVLLPAMLTRHPLGLLVGILLWAPLAWRRTAPVAAAFTVAAAGYFQLWLAQSGPSCLTCANSALMIADASVPFAMYALSAYGPGWASRLGLAVGAVGAWGVAAIQARDSDPTVFA